jgi:tetratricopeptide (TPR) repeat protein
MYAAGGSFMKAKGIIGALLLALALASPLLAAGVCQATGFYQVGAGDEAYAKGDLDGAINHYGKAIKSGDLPQKILAKTYLKRAEARKDKGHNKASMADYNQAIKLNPKDAAAYMNRAVIWQEMDLYDQSIKDISKAIAIDPNKIYYYLKRALAFHLTGRYDRAIADYSKAIEIGPPIGVAYFGRGAAWLMNNKYDEAIADLSKAIALEPQNAAIYYSRATAWHKKGKLATAIHDYSKAIELRPANANYYRERGKAWLAKGVYDQAVSDFSKIIEMDGRNAEAFYLRGMVWEEKRQYQKALDDFDQVLKINRADDQALNALAWLLATCPDAQYRDGQKALRLASYAVALDKRGEYLDTLAAAQAETGDFEGAVATQEKAIALFKRRKGDAELKRQAIKQLELYKQGKPFHGK